MFDDADHGIKARGIASARPVLPAAFLDRDGVINVDHGYTHRPSDLVLTPTALEGIRALNTAGYRVIVATNQSGVARGYYTEEDVARFHEALQARLAIGGAWIDAFYHCPFHPDGIVERYAREHEDRKPSPGMLLKAMRDWPCNKDLSVMFGDKASDMQAAMQAGIRGFLLVTNHCDLLMEVQTFLKQGVISKPPHER